ncbi:UPF0498 protein KIAA1191 [Pteropus alecto]|uniref:Putative monooxygenase p33MONOX n=1 Tax=Pteropus alecto TaxID=9402 RepID=L5L2D2_PTEAL|nr:UPF0498 protein KIAA1191 [Pteropus alecto]
MSLPIGMYRRAFSYDDALEDPAPITPPPADMGSIPWKPVIPERKYQHLAKVPDPTDCPWQAQPLRSPSAAPEASVASGHHQSLYVFSVPQLESVEEGEASVSSPAVTLSSATDSTDKAPVVKAKATHVIMNSLITRQTQESIQRFEQQAGLREAGYTPHKGLTTEETKYLCVAEALHSRERTREEKQPASAQSSPGGTPHSSPKQKPSTMDSGSGDKDRTSADKWSLFGSRALQKFDSGGFATQAYRGAQKPSPMDLIRVQATRTAEDPAAFKPPKLDGPVVEVKKPAPRTHNLKPRDLNVLTPSGF